MIHLRGPSRYGFWGRWREAGICILVVGLSCVPVGAQGDYVATAWNNEFQAYVSKLSLKREAPGSDWVWADVRLVSVSEGVPPKLRDGTVFHSIDMRWLVECVNSPRVAEMSTTFRDRAGKVVRQSSKQDVTAAKATPYVATGLNASNAVFVCQNAGEK